MKKIEKIYLFVIICYFMLMNYNLFIYFNIKMFSILNFNYMLNFNFISKWFFFFFFFISFNGMIYSNFYMMYSLYLFRFVFVKLLFIFSMVLLIFSKSVLFMYIGWDGLGVSSFCLILFFLNFKSQNNGLMTVMMNRMGDGLFVILLLFLLLNKSFFFFNFNKSLFIVFIVFIVFLTKSAQYPFSTWLPLAMAAPTPISALVHSSTLVAAGIYLYMENIVYMKMTIMYTIMFLLCFFTLFMSGMNSLFEMDMKKIIALSTLNQLSLMFISVSLMFKFLGFFHLISHAIFKSLLFFNAGVIIHLWFNSQDYRNYSTSIWFNKMLKFSFMFSIFNLMGLLYLLGFYSKDFILEIIEMNWVSTMLIFFFFFFMFFTFFYSIRLLKMCFFSFLYFKNLNLFWEFKSFVSIFILLMSMSILMTSIFVNNFFFKCISFNFMKFIIIIYILSLIFFLKTIFILKIKKNYFFNSMMFLNLILNNSSKIVKKKNFLKMETEMGVFLSVLFMLYMYMLNSFLLMKLKKNIYLFIFIYLLLMIFYF